MASIKPPRTLTLKRPVGLVVLHTIVALIVVITGSEILARNEAVQSRLPPPMVSGDDNVGQKLASLDRLVAHKGTPDCIILGSSQPGKAINPDILSDVYQRAFHKDFWCFNFSINGTDEAGAGKLARILVREYHPRLLIVGTNFRDFVSIHHSLDIPWTDYYLGSPTADGWLQAHSYAYRYAITYKTALQFNWPKQRIPRVARFTNGFDTGNLSVDVATADFYKDGQFIQYSAMSGSFDIPPFELLWLKRLAAMNSPAVQVVFVEMPLPPAVAAALKNGTATRQTFLDTVGTEAAANNSPFWLTQGVVTIPDGGWFNLFHLNEKGAAVFTRWLGQQLVDAITQGKLRSPTP